MKRSNKHISPPRWSLRLLRFLLRKDYLEEIEGDLEEVYEDNLEQFSARKARRLYSKEVLQLIRPALVRKLGNHQKLNNYAMWQHNIMIAFRGFRKYKTTFLINLLGLSTALTTFLLIFLWIQDERSVDTFHKKNDQLYSALAHFNLPEETTTQDYTPGPLAASMAQEMPEVEAAVSINNASHAPEGIITVEEKSIEISGLFASQNLFEVLTYELIAGKTTSAIANKESIALSASLATKLFGSAENAMGQTLKWTNRYFDQTFKVNAIFLPPPANATVQFEAVVNYQLLADADNSAASWRSGYARTYMVLKEGTDITGFNEKIADYLDGKEGNTDLFTLFVQPYAKNYLYGAFKDGLPAGGRIENVRLFSIVQVFILLIACINFINLSTAQASQKILQIGVKKAIGASRWSLTRQFLTESILVSFISLILALGLSYALLPEFNTLTGKNLSIDSPQLILPILLLALGTGILAGAYPALYMSRLASVKALKGIQSRLTSKFQTRNMLVVFQFTLSIIFILGVIVINRQIQFVQEKALGYDQMEIISFTEKNGLDNPEVFNTELQKVAGVLNVTRMEGEFLEGNSSSGGYSWGGSDQDQQYLFESPKFGYNTVETLGLELLDGRSFSSAFNDDRRKVLINESAANLMQLEAPIGHKIGFGRQSREIIGVLKDFQYGSLHKKTGPMIVRFRDAGEHFLIKVQSGTEVQATEAIEKIFTQFHPGFLFEPELLTDQYMVLYDEETRIARLSKYTALIAIIISCMGLFGLVTFTMERRIKEIGIRKTLGAGRLAIGSMVLRHFTKTIVWSIVIALPLGYFLVKTWLQSFAYAIDLSWWFFALAGCSALFLAWLTISIQTLKAARLNPVDCLRNE